MRHLKETIKDFPPDMELHHYGPKVVKEFPMVRMRNGTEEKFRRFQLLVFNSYLLALEHFKEKEVVYCCWWPTYRKIRTSKFYRHYKIENFDDISENSKNKKSILVEARAYHPSESLTFAFPISKRNEAKHFRDLLSNLKEKNQSKASTMFD